MNSSPPSPSPYSSTFFDHIRAGSRSSAEVIAPLLLSHLPSCSSVADVGCGTGSWLRVFQSLAPISVTGFDGDYVDRSALEIDPASFHPTDLSSPPPWPLSYDLTLSLEVAEHLPPSAAPHFIAFLTALSPVVLFSAAIPHQGGTHHLNEQWPDYWAALFASHDFVPIDFLRDAVWQNPLVERWYAQNILLFVKKAFLPSLPSLQKLAALTHPHSLSRVHPNSFLIASTQISQLRDEVRSLNPSHLGLRSLLRLLPNAFRKACHRALHP
ncbi:MAG: class I SAM-dependent methyltransferase [Verrucomicrobiota bacterium]